MDITRFEDLLKIRSNMQIPEGFWDKRAEDFAASFADLEQKRDKFLFDHLERNGILENVDSVLDVGCGVGRHALHFSKQVSTYLGIDTSDGMIAKALENKEKYQLDNCQFKTMLWQDVKENFDLVFAAMVPAIAGVKDIEELLALSNRYLVIKRFLSDTDSLRREIGVMDNNAHNNPAYTYGLVNILWLLDYMPAVFTGQEIEEKSYTLEEAIQAYDNVFKRYRQEERQEKIRRLEKIMAGQAKAKTIKKREYALIVVDKHLRNPMADIIRNS